MLGDRENGTLGNVSITSDLSDSINGITHEFQGFVINGDDLLVNRISSNAPLRLNGGGDTSFESHDGVDVNFPPTSSPFREYTDVISSTEGQGSDIFDNEIVLPVNERIMNDMPWENAMISDTSFSTPNAQDISTPAESSNDSTLSTLAELEPMAGHFNPPITDLNPLADPFIPLSNEFSFSDTNLSSYVGNVSTSDGDDPLSVLTGLI